MAYKVTLADDPTSEWFKSEVYDTRELAKARIAELEEDDKKREHVDRYPYYGI